MSDQERVVEVRMGRDLDVAIIGAGFSGIGMAIQLRKSGQENFLVFERQAQIGGTWNSTRFPGAGCDIQSNLYSFSYAQNKNWSRKFARRNEIHSYLYDCAKSSGVLPHVKCEHEIVAATWDESANRWIVETNHDTYTAKVLIGGTGYLSEPKLPEIPGLESFAGIAVHTARWDEDLDLGDKRVAVIGTGASTVQVVPAIQPQVEHLDVYQRSSGWVVPKKDRPSGGLSKWATRRIPGLYGLARRVSYWISESHIWFMQNPKRMGTPMKQAKRHLEKSIADPVLVEKLRPDHVIGCKRYLFSDDYYPALDQPNVNLITDPIVRITPKGIVTEDGIERTVDVLVLATGYQVTKSEFAKRVKGKAGRSLSEAWSLGQYAYLGSVVPGFPNFFMLLGPNSAIAHTSSILMSELQVNYAMSALEAIKAEGLATVDVKPDVVEKYNNEVQEAIRKGVWSQGCTSWYIDEFGKNTAVWPFSVPNFKKRARRFEVSQFLTTQASAGDEIDMAKSPAY